METIYLDYAAGSLSPSARLLVDAHLALQPERRSEIDLWEAIGGALLEEGFSPLAPGAFEALGLDSLSQVADSPGMATHGLPAPLAEVVGRPLETLDWSVTLPGMREYAVPGWPQARLVRLAAGRTIPRHGHGGAELTLVLEGAFSDQRGTYRRGDVCVADETVEHSPRVSPDGDCLCFAVIEGAYHPKGIWRVISAVHDQLEARKARKAIA